MINNVGEPLTEISAFGNWWHGSVSTANQFKNRAGMTLLSGTNGFLPNTDALNANGSDAHLVDFDLPTLTTPTDDIAIGLERLNKAILFGGQKFYSICGIFQFGSGGWPYRAPDGSVWHMEAEKISSGQLGIYAKRLRNHAGGTRSLVLELAVPHYSSVHGEAPVGVAVNFSPKGGDKAAVHSWFSTHPTTIVCFIAELVVTGGDNNSLPSVSGSVTHDLSSALIESVLGDFVTYSTKGVVWVPHPTPPVDGGYYTSRVPDGSSYIYTVEFTVADISSDTTKRAWINHYICAVVYGREGGRQELSWRSEEILLNWHCYDASTTGTYVWYGDGRDPVDTQVASLSFKEVRTTTLRLMRDSAVVASLNKTQVSYRSQSKASGADYGPVVDGAVEWSGNAYDPSHSDYFVTDLNAIYFEMAASNILQVRGTNGANNILLEYIGPDVAGERGVGNVTTLGSAVAIDPITGTFDSQIKRYF
jgi:hypothetical protein